VVISGYMMFWAVDVPYIEVMEGRGIGYAFVLYRCILTLAQFTATCLSWL
jgi:hypothetical protein